MELSTKIQDLEGSNDSESKKLRHWHAKIADMVKQLKASDAEGQEPCSVSKDAIAAADPHDLQFK